MPPLPKDDLGPGQQQLLDAILEAIGTRADATSVAALATRIQALQHQQKQCHAAVMAELGRISGGPKSEIDRPPPPSWQDTDDLIDPYGRPVFGVFVGSGSDRDTIEAELGRNVGISTIYWKSFAPPGEACQRLLDRGTIPRLELELTTAGGGADIPMQDEHGVSYWKRLAEGVYDDKLEPMLRSIGSLPHPIVVSICHEADLSSEQGAYPKGSEADEDQAGSPEEFALMWRHVVGLARELDVTNVRWFWNMSGGYSNAAEIWTRMFPGHVYVDFVGWDFYNWYGVREGDPWTHFADAIQKFGRWDWYERTCPYGTDRWVPMMVGEYGVSEGPGGVEDAGRWLLDAIEWTLAHPAITHLIYFSVSYLPSHTRQLDDHGQRQAVLGQIGADRRLAWAEDGWSRTGDASSTVVPIQHNVSKPRASRRTDVRTIGARSYITAK